MVQRKNKRLIPLILALVAYAGAAVSGEAAGKQAFVTWDVFEPDKCASIWLIRRFIAPEAEILFFKKDLEALKGILFDTPEADFRRSHNRSTYETLLAHYRLQDERLIHIGRIIHDIEINTWQRKAFPETLHMQKEVMDLLADAKPKDIIGLCVDYFGELYNLGSQMQRER